MCLSIDGKAHPDAKENAAMRLERLKPNLRCCCLAK